MHHESESGTSDTAPSEPIDTPRRHLLQRSAAAAAGVTFVAGAGAALGATLEPAPSATEAASSARFAGSHVLVTGATSGIGGQLA